MEFKEKIYENTLRVLNLFESKKKSKQDEDIDPEDFIKRHVDRSKLPADVLEKVKLTFLDIEKYHRFLKMVLSDFIDAETFKNKKLEEEIQEGTRLTYRNLLENTQTTMVIMVYVAIFKLNSLNQELAYKFYMRMNSYLAVELFEFLSMKVIFDKFYYWGSLLWYPHEVEEILKSTYKERKVFLDLYDQMHEVMKKNGHIEVQNKWWTVTPHLKQNRRRREKVEKRKARAQIMNKEFNKQVAQLTEKIMTNEKPVIVVSEDGNEKQ